MLFIINKMFIIYIDSDWLWSCNNPCNHCIIFSLFVSWGWEKETCLLQWNLSLIPGAIPTSALWNLVLTSKGFSTYCTIHQMSLLETTHKCTWHISYFPLNIYSAISEHFLIQNSFKSVKLWLHTYMYIRFVYNECVDHHFTKGNSYTYS